MDNILIIEPDHGFSQRLGQEASNRGLQPFIVNSLAQARALLKENKFSLLVTELKLADGSGLHLLEEVKPLPLRSVMVTSFGSIATAVAAIRHGALHYLTKPLNPATIFLALADSPTLLTEQSAPPPSLARVEWEHIQQVLFTCNNNISRAAEMLAIHRRTLQRKLQKNPPQK